MTSLTRLPARAAGRLLASGLGALAVLRDGRPLHPEGAVHEGRLEVDGGGPWTGVPLLDEASTRRCLVRLSRAVGTPDHIPDIEGIAVRILPTAGSGEGSEGDLLFAGTGTGPLTRHLLAWRRQAGPCSTLLPLAAPRGRLLLLLEPLSPSTWRLSSAPPGGAWVARGRLLLDRPATRPRLRFDPVLNPVPGLPHPPLWAALREPSYRRARRVPDRA